MQTLKITYKLEIGCKGIDRNPNNPLSRAIKNLVKSGKPFKDLHLCFCNDGKCYRWFGVFILSAANRIIFFPGFKQVVNNIIAYQGSKTKLDGSFFFDHTTLESNLKKWHLTTSNSNNHLGSFCTLSLNKCRFLWFGLSILNFEVLQKVYESTIISYFTPSSDIKRRTKVFLESRKNKVFQILEFHSKALTCFNEYFLHFGIVVGQKKFPVYYGGKLGIPDGSPFLEKSFPRGEYKLARRIHKFSLSENIDIQIATLSLPGRLLYPISLTYQGKSTL